MKKDEVGLGVIDIATHGCILVAKWVVKCVDKCTSWPIFLIHCPLSYHHSGRMRGYFGLCDMISSPHSFHVVGSFILKIISGAWKKVADLVQWHFSGR